MRLLPIAVSCLLLAHSSAHAAAWDKPGWQLTFQDEFDGAQIDAAKWVKRYKWGEAPINGELQAYVDDAFQLQNGILTIVGDKRPASYAGQTFQYASGVLCSVPEQTYGYFETRLKVPAGQGMWPAFWLLGTNGVTGVNEIDIHEILGNQPSTVHMTVHWGTDYNAGHQSDGTSWVGPDFSADFHTFGLEWNSDSIIWSIDGVEHKRHTGAGVPQVAMYLIVNLAIGGTWPGAPDATTPFPGLYQVDYVRAYSRLPDAGVTATDGATTTGGVGGSGGVAAPGGITGSGGALATGGVVAMGGVTATGGVAGTGGATETDGTARTGGSVGTGGSATGGATAAGATTRGGTGCGCRVSGTPSTAELMVFAVLALGWRRRRRR
jgi:MYXO-CTERM domain-containing protein